MLETYLPAEAYRALIDRLAAIADAGPSIFTGAIDVDAMKIALGEIANVGPDSIQESESALT